MVRWLISRSETCASNFPPSPAPRRTRTFCWRKARSFPFANGHNPIHHVIYIVKENRTYDQILGDLKVGDGDPSLVLYGEDVTPNQHQLALQFGVLDNFYDSGEVSGDGHMWSLAATTTDYNEKTWQINYRGSERTYDYEGLVADEYPLQHNLPDVNEPQSKYLFSNAAAHALTYRHYGEFVATEWCEEKRPAEWPSPKAGTPPPPGHECRRPRLLLASPCPHTWDGRRAPRVRIPGPFQL